MKKIRVGANERIIKQVLYPYCFLMLFIGVSVYRFGTTLIQLILAIIATIFTGCVLIFVSVGVSRRNKALSGHESTGLVKNVYYTNQYSLSYVEFEFVNDYNETSICKAFIEVNSIKDLQSLQIEREIPIYVNGKLAFYDADGINNGKLAQQYSDINENN